MPANNQDNVTILSIGEYASSESSDVESMNSENND